MTSERLSLELVELPSPRTGLVQRVLGALARYRRAEQQRAELTRFDDRMLRDIGLTAAGVWREPRLPPWSA